MPGLKLVALDAEDLEIISAQVQDAVLKVGEIKWLPREARVVITMNRFAWDKPAKARGTHERRKSALHFARVQSVKCSAMKPEAKDTVLSLLAIRFEPTDVPGGIVELLFAGGGTLRLAVECIEASLADLGAAWATERQPAHELGV